MSVLLDIKENVRFIGHKIIILIYLYKRRCIIHKVIKIRKDCQMRKERDIIIKVIKSNNISNRRIAEFFARKYIENREDISKEKS